MNAIILILVCFGISFDISQAQNGHVNFLVRVLKLSGDGTVQSTSNGRKCCDGMNDCTTANDKCDIFFMLCLDGNCNLGKPTQVLNNNNQFEDSTTTMHMDMYGNFNSWQTNLTNLAISVYDKDMHDSELMANLYTTLDIHPDSNIVKATAHRRNLIYSHQYTRTTLDIDIKVWCQDGYTGSDCDVLCHTDPYHVCSYLSINKTHLIKPACMNEDIITLPINGILYSLGDIRAGLTSFLGHVICPSNTTELDITFNFVTNRSVEFTATCDKQHVTDFEFITKYYIEYLAMKTTLGSYFQGIQLVSPVVRRDIHRQARVLIMLQLVEYQNQHCVNRSCSVQFRVCVTPNGCETLVSALDGDTLRSCDGYLIDPSRSQTSPTSTQKSTMFIPLTTYPVELRVYIQTNDHSNMLSHPVDLIAYRNFIEARPVKYVMHGADNSSLQIAMSMFCSTDRSGNRCQHHCHITDRQTTECDQNGNIVCKQGYNLSHLRCVNINECEGSNPCLHGGTCHDTLGSFTCHCPITWTGPTCNIDVDECTTYLCINSVSCSNSPGGFICNCSPGFTGGYCDADIDECLTKVCTLHSSSCTNYYGGFSCECYRGWSGQLCDEDVNECENYQAQYPDRTMCVNNGTCVNLPGKFECQCSSGWDPKSHCHRDINECSNTSICLHGGTCSNYQGSYNCSCTPGWTGDNCEEDMNECLTSVCRNNGQCQNTIGGFTCSCNAAWNGTHCETDVDECNVPNICKNSGTCINLDGGYNCSCVTGWQGENCQLDVNECADPYICLNGGFCTNYNGGYNCSCPLGWMGLDCSQDFNECKARNACHHGGTCYNLQGGFKCLCKTGWHGKLCDVDVNECQQSPCHHGGTCHNHDGGFNCSCTVGWQGVHCEIDIDECTNSHSACQHNGRCTNFPGGYICSCTSAWTGSYCESDVDECNQANTCQHSGTCINLDGGYNCSCVTGWQGENCQLDFNECFDPYICLNGGTCNNSDGGFSCRCPFEWSGNRCEIDVNECIDSDICHNGGSCKNTDGGFTCMCTSGWTGPNCEHDVNECLNSDQCRNGGKCINLPGHYNCTCTEGWKGSTCQDHESVDQLPCDDDPSGYCNSPGALSFVCQHNDTAHKYCRRSCGLCPDQICDDDPSGDCSSPEALAFICRHNDTAEKYCKRSCGLCPPHPNVTLNGNMTFVTTQSPKATGCSQLTSPRDGHVNVTSTSVGSVSVYGCDDGFTLTGDKERYCLQTRLWSGHEPGCVRGCSQLTSPRDGHVNVTSTSVGSVSVYGCDDGFTLSGNKKRYCLQTRLWSGHEPICIKACGNLTNPVNGDVTVTGHTPGSTATFTCNLGYTLRGGAHRYCLNTGTWTDVNPNCIGECPHLRPPRHGFLDDYSTTVGSVVHTYCISGYIQQGSAARTCQENGTWSGTDTTCTIN